jgi:hypothetical protein
MRTFFFIVLSIFANMHLTADDTKQNDKNSKPRISPQEIEKLKSRHDDLLKIAQQKEVELKKIQEEISDIKRKLMPTEPNDVDFFKTPQELFKHLPKDAEPKPGPNGSIERLAFEKWMAENVVGKKISFESEVIKVLENVIGGDVHVYLLLKRQMVFLDSDSRFREKYYAVLPFGNSFKLGKHDCLACVTDKSLNEYPVLLEGGDVKHWVAIHIAKATSDQVKLARELKGKRKKFHAKITEAKCIALYKTDDKMTEEQKLIEAKDAENRRVNIAFVIKHEDE